MVVGMGLGIGMGMGMCQDDPLYPSSKKKYQVDSNNKNQGESNMIKEKVNR